MNAFLKKNKQKKKMDQDKQQKAKAIDILSKNIRCFISRVRMINADSNNIKMLIVMNKTQLCDQPQYIVKQMLQILDPNCSKDQNVVWIYFRKFVYCCLKDHRLIQTVPAILKRMRQLKNKIPGQHQFLKKIASQHQFKTKLKDLPKNYNADLLIQFFESLQLSYLKKIEKSHIWQALIKRCNLMHQQIERSHQCSKLNKLVNHLSQQNYFSQEQQNFQQTLNVTRKIILSINPNKVHTKQQNIISYQQINIISYFLKAFISQVKNKIKIIKLAHKPNYLIDLHLQQLSVLCTDLFAKLLEQRILIKLFQLSHNTRNTILNTVKDLNTIFQGRKLFFVKEITSLNQNLPSESEGSRKIQRLKDQLKIKIKMQQQMVKNKRLFSQHQWESINSYSIHEIFQTCKKKLLNQENTNTDTDKDLTLFAIKNQTDILVFYQFCKAQQDCQKQVSSPIQKKIRIVSFPLHFDNTFMFYNIHRKKNISIHKCIITNPLLGQNCTMTSKCYIDYQDLKNSQQSEYTCKQCHRKSANFLLDIGLKLFLKKLSKQNTLKLLTESQLKINPHSNRYQLVRKLTGIMGFLTNQIIQSNCEKLSSQIFANHNNQTINYQISRKLIKQKIHQIEARSSNKLSKIIKQQQVKIYSWCRHYENKLAYILLFIKGLKNPLKVSLQFFTRDQKGVLRNLFSQQLPFDSRKQCVISYYFKANAFIAIVTLKKLTLYFSSFLDRKYGLFNLSKRVLRFQQFYEQKLVRMYPSLWINQLNGKCYVMGGFDMSQQYSQDNLIPFNTVQFVIEQNSINIQPRTVLNSFNPLTQGNQTIYNNNIGIRGTTLLGYFCFGDLKQKSQKGSSPSHQKWYSFGGSYCQNDRFSKTKNHVNPPGIRKIEFLKHNFAVFPQQRENKKVNFKDLYPFSIQVPQVRSIQGNVKGKYAIIFKGRQCKGQRLTICRYDVEKNEIEAYSNIQFPFQQLECYADNNCSILQGQDKKFYLRMTYPCKQQQGKGRYLVVQYNIQKNTFYYQIFQL